MNASPRSTRRWDRTAARHKPPPWEEVRDFFHYCDNYIDAVDRAAERFAGQAEGDLVAHTEAVLSRGWASR
jgi:predicted transcriptional regulator